MYVIKTPQPGFYREGEEGGTGGGRENECTGGGEGEKGQKTKSEGGRQTRDIRGGMRTWSDSSEGGV